MNNIIVPIIVGVVAIIIGFVIAKILEKNKYIRRPAVQLDIKKEKFENIVKRFR